MKTKHFIYAIGLAALPLLASCSDDDDFPTEVKPAATGTFTDADGLHLTLLGALHAISTAAYKKCNVGDQGYYWTATIDKSMAYECAYIRKVMAGKNQVMRNSMPTRRYAMVRYVR